MSNKIVYNVQVDAKGYELVRFGSQTVGGQCAQLVRFGQRITKFVASPAQVKALKKGKKVRVTMKMIDRAGNLCRTTLLDGAGRRKRR